MPCKIPRIHTHASKQYLENAMHRGSETLFQVGITCAMQKPTMRISCCGKEKKLATGASLPFHAARKEEGVSRRIHEFEKDSIILLAFFRIVVASRDNAFMQRKQNLPRSRSLIQETSHAGVDARFDENSGCSIAYSSHLPTILMSRGLLRIYENR